ncbi:hypothetical protein BLX24_01195 [Arsenicibacter rosenii]|uniref:Outer membrane protein beta-barrel domain-containing protein n=2 Tax=Arsenicibacter rosenii TaxID=1750698 RepID=A0A1S2VS49_9BACT|nr:hypothetical protein BLX24_01195 [Arsenicibacter rosenii]
MMACGVLPGMGQPQPQGTLKNWPLTIQAGFHVLAMPLQQLDGAFANPGLSLGTELKIGRKGTFVQSVQAGFYRNLYAGDGAFVWTQTGWQPHVGPVYLGLKAGLGWQYSFHPNKTLAFEGGEWRGSNSAGKGMLCIPLGATLGLNYTKAIAPFIGYQFIVLTNYNPSVPLVPTQQLQAGLRIQLNGL